MKKTLISLLVCASLAIVPSAFALTSMSADSMKAATGQAGVSIALNGVAIETYTGATTYTDSDGYLGSGLGGSITITDRHTVTHLDGMMNGNLFVGQFMAATGGVAPIGSVEDTSALTIDVGVCPMISLSGYLNDNPDPTDNGNPITDVDVLAGMAMQSANNVVGVVIGLPTLLITTSEDSYSIQASSASALPASNDGAEYIAIKTGKSVTAILGGSIEIAPH